MKKLHQNHTKSEKLFERKRKSSTTCRPPPTSSTFHLFYCRKPNCSQRGETGGEWMGGWMDLLHWCEMARIHHYITAGACCSHVTWWDSSENLLNTAWWWPIRQLFGVEVNKLSGGKKVKRKPKDSDTVRTAGLRTWFLSKRPEHKGSYRLCQSRQQKQSRPSGTANNPLFLSGPCCYVNFSSE